MFVFKNKRIRKFIKSITVTLSVTVMLFLISLPIGCTGKKEELAAAVTVRDSLAVLETYGVQSLVSDSGMIRYRITAGEWLMFDSINPPYWSFEDGLHLERFDSLLQVDANIKADTAYFYNKKELWELRSNVSVENIKGEKFVTDLLYWDQVKEKIYSDAFITIYKEDQVLSGYGFESDQRLEVYVIHRTSGILYLDEEDEEEVLDSDKSKAHDKPKQAPLDSIDK